MILSVGNPAWRQHPGRKRNNKEADMQFSHLDDAGTANAGKVVLVAAVHVLLALGLIKGMNAKMISLPKIPESVAVMMPQLQAPPAPMPEPAPFPLPQVAPPKVLVPQIELDLRQPPPDLPQVQAAPQTDAAPAAPGAMPPQARRAEAGNHSGSNSGGAMRTAVLADASCARPDYPARAARNGESGTVVLALLVGTDGRVASSRVQSSSGSRELDKAAVAALSMCRFKPATRGGVAEQAWAHIAYVWTLEQ
jgi:periplasmic protein TonB